MVEGPDQSYFAVAVEDDTPAALKPFADVEAQVRDEWEHDARRKEQERAAASLLTATQAGSSLDDAATVAGQRLQTTPPVLRAQPAPAAPTPGVPTQMIEPLFSLKLNGTTMIETPEAFYVLSLAEIKEPDPAADPPGTAQIRTALTQAIGQDIEMTFAAVLRDQAKPQVNRTLFDSMSQP
jgi:peptidyl-prolyl cis-trans isomerase D